MRRLLCAVAVACAFTFVPDAISRLEPTNKLVQSMRDVAAAVGVPGTAMGFVLAGGRVHDIDSGVCDAANFAFYVAAMWLLLKVISVIKARRLTQRNHLLDH